MLSYPSLQVLNLFQATFVLGFNLVLSLISIPCIVSSPSPILAIRQWNLQFKRGRAIATPLCATQLVLSIILAYGAGPGLTEQGWSALRWLYTFSALFSFFIFPFTLYFIQPLNEILGEKYKVQLQLHYADLPEKEAGMQTARVSH